MLVPMHDIFTEGVVGCQIETTTEVPVFFIDNEAACAAMIRGSSKEPDVGAIVNAVHWLPYQADCRAWFECKEVALKTLDLEEKRSEEEEKEDVGR